MLDEVLTEEFKKDEEKKKQDVGKQFNETVASEEVRGVAVGGRLLRSCMDALHGVLSPPRRAPSHPPSPRLSSSLCRALVKR